MPKPGKHYDNFLINYNICEYPLWREKKLHWALYHYVYIYLMYVEYHTLARLLNKYKW